jgi:hypothetical protein
MPPSGLVLVLKRLGQGDNDIVAVIGTVDEVRREFEYLMALAAWYSQNMS